MRFLNESGKTCFKPKLIIRACLFLTFIVLAMSVVCWVQCHQLIILQNKTSNMYLETNTMLTLVNRSFLDKCICMPHNTSAMKMIYVPD